MNSTSRTPDDSYTREDATKKYFDALANLRKVCEENCENEERKTKATYSSNWALVMAQKRLIGVLKLSSSL